MYADDEFLEKLRATYEFPCAYTFKLIGSKSEAFEGSILREAETVIPGVRPQVSKRDSSGGKYLSITLVMEVASAEVVKELYSRFRNLDGVRFML